MKKSVLEAVKTGLIILLIFSLVLLFAASIPSDAIRSTPWLSTVLQPLAPLLGLPAAELAYVADAQLEQSAAQPMTISIRNSSGRHTAQWDFAALDAAYETLGSMLGQALDTAEPLTVVRQFLLTQALARPSVCFDYGFPLPASLVAAWLDAAPEQELPSSIQYVLVLEDDQVWLYLQGASCLRAPTLVDPTAFSALLEQFSEDGSQFAFEAQSHLSSLSILPAAAPSVRAARIETLCTTRYVETLANDLGFNPYDDSRYTDSTNVTHFSEPGGSLKISADGDIRFAATSERITADGSSPERLVETARTLLSLAVDSSESGARLYLSGFSQKEAVTVCTFEYVLNGVPVRWADGPAAEVTFTGKTVTELNVRAVRFAFTGQPQKLLPPVQAAAVLPKNGSLQLQYHAAAEKLAVGWAK